MLEPMLNRKHDVIDHIFTVMVKYLQNYRIYPLLTRSLGTETDAATRLHGYFKIQLEGSRKDVEHGCGVKKLFFWL